MCSFFKHAHLRKVFEASTLKVVSLTTTIALELKSPKYIHLHVCLFQSQGSAYQT